MPRRTATPAKGAVVIPFPRFSRPKHRRAPVDFKSSDFDAGFEFAMALVHTLKANGCLVFNKKGV